MKNNKYLDSNSSLRMSVLLTMMYALGINPDMSFGKRDNTDDKVITPPQTEESKQYLINRAEEKRLKKARRNLK